MVRILLSLMCLLTSVSLASAQELQSVLQTHAQEVAKPSRKSVGVLLDDLVASGLPQVPVFLEQWAERSVWQDDATGLFYFAKEAGDTLTLRDVDTGEETTASSDSFSQLRPNGGVRRVIGTALVQFQLSDPDPERRSAALESIARRSDASQLDPLFASLEGENDPILPVQSASPFPSIK